MRTSRTLGLVGAVVALAVAGCSSAPVYAPSNGMMGAGTGMTGSAPPGYVFPRSTCAPPSQLPGADVEVVLGDMGMHRMLSGVAPLGSRMMMHVVPGSVAAGPVSLVVLNMGWRTHEVVVLPLPAGAAVGQRVPGPDGRIDESGSLGEVSATCADGSGEGIAAGSAGWVTLTLAPGRYELVCNEPNHYADGMSAELDVT